MKCCTRRGVASSFFGNAGRQLQRNYSWNIIIVFVPRMSLAEMAALWKPSMRTCRILPLPLAPCNPHRRSLPGQHLWGIYDLSGRGVCFQGNYLPFFVLSLLTLEKWSNRPCFKCSKLHWLPALYLVSRKSGQIVYRSARKLILTIMWNFSAFIFKEGLIFELSIFIFNNLKVIACFFGLLIFFYIGD